MGTHAWQHMIINSMHERLTAKIVDFAIAIKELGQEDPRRIIHALKVGLAISIVSLFYYFQPLSKGFGDSAMWAVLTVVIVFEFSVGATLGKGFNRMMATCVAGFLGVLAHHLASLSGDKAEPILLGIFCFLVAGVMTFTRFFPRVKARYDYGILIFILTFSLVSVSGYRDDEMLRIALQRLSTIIIGCWIAFLICVFICPVWSGVELHNLIASNLYKLGIFLEGFGEEYFCRTTTEEKLKENKSFRYEYHTVLGSKASEETMANLASWEPSHGQFKFRHQWKQYLKIGAVARKCAYKVDTLNTYLDSNVHIPVEIPENVKETCIRLSLELGKALKELSSEIKKIQRTTSTKPHINKAKGVAQDLKSLLQTRDIWEDFTLSSILPIATIASLLMDIVNCLECLSREVNELAFMANFKFVNEVKETQDKKQGLEMSIEATHVVIVKDDIIEKDNREEVETLSPEPEHDEVKIRDVIKDHGVLGKEISSPNS